MYAWWSRRRWIDEKRAIAERLASGELGAGYCEAVILLSATFSAVAAGLWPGRNIDRARFVELLVRIGPQSEICKTVSVPLLVQALEEDGRSQEAVALRRSAGLSVHARVYTGPEIDRSEEDVHAVCPHLTIEHIRRYSYASLLYQEVRSAYAHEYQPGELAGTHPMTMQSEQRVSYINRLVNVDPPGMKRLIHFQVDWLSELAGQLAEALEASDEVQWPSKWWTHGA